jgi:CheY-like chemotaxis protein
MPNCAVLVVDDDQDTRDAMIEVLRFEGYTVEGAANGQEALEGMHAGRFKPDVILVDLYMPTMDGHEFRLALRDDSRYAHIPVIVCTGDSPRSAESGAFGTLQKPVDIDTLTNIVRRGCAASGTPKRASA